MVMRWVAWPGCGLGVRCAQWCLLHRFETPMLKFRHSMTRKIEVAWPLPFGTRTGTCCHRGIQWGQYRVR